MLARRAVAARFGVILFRPDAKELCAARAEGQVLLARVGDDVILLALQEAECALWRAREVGQAAGLVVTLLLAISALHSAFIALLPRALLVRGVRPLSYTLKIE